MHIWTEKRYADDRKIIREQDVQSPILYIKQKRRKKSLFFGASRKRLSEIF